MQESLVLSPEINFDGIQRKLAELSWSRQQETSATAPLLPGEPELASWTHNHADGRIVYTFNPVVSLRVLSFYGESAAELRIETSARLPVLTPVDVLELLKSADLQKILLGIFAAGEMEATETLGALTSLLKHPEQIIAKAAAKTYQKLLRVMAEKNLHTLVREKARHPELSALFPLLGDAAQRQQILRWLIHDYTEANEQILAVLRTALRDKDWEVRATAMLAAARFKAAPLLNLVRQVELPQTSREGLDAGDRRLLRALHHASVLLLAGHTIPAEPTDSEDEREVARAQMLRCVAGLPVSSFDRVFTFVRSLTQPLMTDEEETIQQAVDRVN